MKGNMPGKRSACFGNVKKRLYWTVMSRGRNSRTDRGVLRLLLAGIIASVLWVGPGAGPTIYLIGDSTVADKPLVGNPERGWGEALPLFLNKGVVVDNRARNGRSTKSFIDEGLWEDVRTDLQPGDFVLIQFGHNDAKTEDPRRYADPDTAYQQNLRRFVLDTRSHGATPILITPVVRRRFDTAGVFYDVHGRYPDAVRAVGRELDVPVIDLHEMSTRLLRRLGSEQSKKLFLFVPEGVFSGFPEGRTDNTHFSWEGARTMAELVVEDIRAHGGSLASVLSPHNPKPSIGLRKVVQLLYSRQLEPSEAGTIGHERQGDLWQDSTASGYSLLSRLIARLGGEIDTLLSSPSPEQLRRTSVLVIVDPHAHVEGKQAGGTGEREAQLIEDWVRGGGVLVLFPQEARNGTTSRVNTIGRRFGLTFSEDRLTEIGGGGHEKGYAVAGNTHPMFSGVRRVFMTDPCPIHVRAPAAAVLSVQGRCVIGESRMGRGTVVAFSCQWMRNELLAEGTQTGKQNSSAAEAVCSWLFDQAKPVY